MNGLKELEGPGANHAPAANGAPGCGRRFIFYANELIGLGQLRRTLALASTLSAGKSSPSSLVITGSPVEPMFELPPRVDTVKLPGRSRDLNGRQHSARLALDTDELRYLRSQIALASAAGFNPDVAVVDKLPLGQGGELRQTLEELRHNSDCKLVLGLRDIEDSQENVRRNWGPEMRAEIERYYDAILVYGPASAPSAITSAGFQFDIPVHHVGYVGTPVPESGPADLVSDYLLATAGGGFDGFRLLAAFAEALRLRPLPCPAVMVTGPLMSRPDRARLRGLTQGLDIQLFELRRDMEYVIAGAAGVVSMAGYNTVSELMRARKPALLVPRSGPSHEQRIRARALAEAGLQDMLDPAEISPQSMRAALDRLLNRRGPEVLTEDWSGGTDRAASLLTNLAAAPARRKPTAACAQGA